MTALILATAFLLVLPRSSARGDSSYLLQKVSSERAEVEALRQTIKRQRMVIGKQRRYERKLERKLGSLRRAVRYSPLVNEALNLAATVYGNGATLRRRAWCESRFDPRADNGEAKGLLQFLPSTWATTPYARFSIFSPYSNALAAGWMFAHGRGGEWSCR